MSGFKKDFLWGGAVAHINWKVAGMKEEKASVSLM